MNKRQFIDRLEYAGDLALNFAEEILSETGNLPRDIVYSIFPPHKLEDEIRANEPIKIWGGRMLTICELRNLSAVTAGTYLWVDGKVPAWINICVVGADSKNTEIEIMACAKIVKADPNVLHPDLHMVPGNPLVPFRIRGPSVADWRTGGRNA